MLPPRLAPAGRGLVDADRAARPAAGPVHADGRRRRLRRRPARLAHRADRGRRRRVHRRPTARPGARAGRRAARRTSLALAARPAAAGHDGADGPGALGIAHPDRSAHRRARLRPRDGRAADGHLDEHHRGRARRHRGRAEPGRRPGRGRLVGAAAAGRSLGRHALAAAGEQYLGRAGRGRGARGTAAGRIRLPAGGGFGGGQGAAAVRPRRVDGGPVRGQLGAADRPALDGHPAASQATAFGDPGPDRGQRPVSLGPGAQRADGGDRPGPPHRVRPGRHGHQRTRLRRPELGAARSAHPTPSSGPRSPPPARTT